MEGVVVLIIRHAERLLSGPGLSPAGDDRARSYVDYFRNFSFHSKLLKIDFLIAAADSHKSHRPRLTLEPLGHALGLKLHMQIRDKEFLKAVKMVESRQRHDAFLICWRHHEIPGLLRAFGVAPGLLLPDGNWPEEEFGWLLQLRFDVTRRLVLRDTRRIELSADQA